MKWQLKWLVNVIFSFNASHLNKIIDPNKFDDDNKLPFKSYKTKSYPSKIGRTLSSLTLKRDSKICPLTFNGHFVYTFYLMSPSLPINFTVVL